MTSGAKPRSASAMPSRVSTRRNVQRMSARRTSRSARAASFGSSSTRRMRTVAAILPRPCISSDDRVRHSVCVWRFPGGRLGWRTTWRYGWVGNSHNGMTGSRSQGVGYAVGATEPRRATCERSRSMSTNLRYLGLDVHADTIAVAVAEPSGEVRSLGVIPNRPEAVAKLIRKLGSREHLRACYEAGPCGYVLYWQLTKLGVGCDVVAPTLVPTKPGDRVKTDRRDAEKLARCHRAGDLTRVWVPDAAHEALRDLVRAREAAKQDQLRARHRLGKFLLRHGIRPPAGAKPWTQQHRRWLDTLTLALPALDATLGDYLHEVDHAAARLERLETALAAAIATAPAALRTLIAA